MLEPNPWLVTSSLCFLIPTTLNAIKDQWSLYTVNVTVVFVSSLYHANKLFPLFYVDIVAANSLALIHLFYTIESYVRWITILDILYCAFLFYYGYAHKQYVWDVRKSHATFWHVSMHISVIASATAVALLS